MLAINRLEAAEAAGALRAAIAELPTKQRMTVELRLYEDIPFRDIAEALGISEGARQGELPLRRPPAARPAGAAADTGSARGRGR